MPGHAARGGRRDGAGPGTRAQGHARRDVHDAAPPVPAYVSGSELDPKVYREVTESLGPPGEEVCRRLVAAALALEAGDGATAAAHAEVARRRGARLAVVREATGVVAYQVGDYALALRDLQAARRIGGSVSAVAVLADCERALGRPARALAVAASVSPADLEISEVVELLIVTAGARRDLGQPEAAVATLHTRLLDRDGDEPWQARLWFAYGEALVAAGRVPEGERWLRRAAAHPAAADRDDVTVEAHDPGVRAGADDTGLVLDLDPDAGAGSAEPRDRRPPSPVRRERPDQDARRQLRPEGRGLDGHEQAGRHRVEDVDE